MRRIVVIIGVIVVLTGGGWLAKAWTTWRNNIRTTKFNADIENLFVGLQQYKDYVGSYPTGNNADVVRQLMGENNKKVIILVGRKSDLNSKGEFVDPWGTPVRIYFSGAGILVRSAGPNRRFDDSTIIEGDDFFRSN